MGFSEANRRALLSLRGVGPTFIRRLEEIGINSFAELRRYTVTDITGMVAAQLKTTCWKNSPQAKAAIAAAIERANG